MAEQNDSPGGRGEERRDSPRVPMQFEVRLAEGDAVFETREGDLSLGGCAWRGGPMEAGTHVELRFWLPSMTDALRVRGEVLHVRTGPQGPATHVRFVELPMETELAIARHLDDVQLAATKS